MSAQIEQLSHAGIPYGIRRDGSVFFMAGDHIMNAKGMTLERIRKARGEKTETRDFLWLFEGQRPHFAQMRRRMEAMAQEANRVGATGATA